MHGAPAMRRHKALFVKGALQCSLMEQMIFGPVGVIGVWAPAIANAKWHLNQEYVTLGRFITEAIVYTNMTALI